MLEPIGWVKICVTEPKESCIVGASDTANEELRKRVKNEHLKMSEGAMRMDRDSYEKAGMQESIYSSEEYNKISNSQITGMPGSCLADQNGYEVRTQVEEMMYGYHTGKISRDDVILKIKDICKDMRVYQAQSRHTSGQDKDDNLQMLEQLYELFQKANVSNASAACFEKGEAIASNNGGTQKNDWVYYDSDYYYSSEEMKECFRTAISELAGEWKTGIPDFNEIEKNTKYTLDGEMDFNSCWNWRAMQKGNRSIKDYDEVPPKDFTFTLCSEIDAT